MLKTLDILPYFISYLHSFQALLRNLQNMLAFLWRFQRKTTLKFGTKFPFISVFIKDISC